MISEQDVKDAISSVMWAATETHKRLALDEAMTGRFGTSSESYIMSGKIEACNFDLCKKCVGRLNKAMAQLKKEERVES